jgi:hypothetical protein
MGGRLEGGRGTSRGAREGRQRGDDLAIARRRPARRPDGYLTITIFFLFFVLFSSSIAVTCIPRGREGGESAEVLGGEEDGRDRGRTIS